MHSTETKQSEPCIKTKVNANINTEENPKTTEQTKEKRQGHRYDLQTLTKI